VNRIFIRLALSVLFATSSAALAAEQKPAAEGASVAPYHEGSVWDISFIRTVPGMDDDYLKSLSATWKRTMDEAKKQGLVLSYKVISTPAVGAEDWNIMLMVEFKNWAAFDGLDAKFRALESKLVGNPDQMRTLMTKRQEVRHILGNKFGQELILK
jgi:hypothetical protein